jgi:hypothetical protein
MRCVEGRNGTSAVTVWSLAILSLVVSSLVVASTASAADPLVDWAAVKDVCQTIDSGRQMGGGFVAPRVLPALDLETHGRALPLPDAAMPVPSATDSQPVDGLLASTIIKTSVSLVGLSSSVVPAVTADLVAERRQVSVRTVSSSFGQVSGLRLYRPKVGVSVGAVTPDFVGIK